MLKSKFLELVRIYTVPMLVDRRKYPTAWNAATSTASATLTGASTICSRPRSWGRRRHLMPRHAAGVRGERGTGGGWQWQHIRLHLGERASSLRTCSHTRAATCGRIVWNGTLTKVFVSHQTLNTPKIGYHERYPSGTPQERTWKIHIFSQGSNNDHELQYKSISYIRDS